VRARRELLHYFAGNLGHVYAEVRGLLTGTFQKGCGTESDNDGEMPVSGFRLLCAMADS
jgi:hypothetical protein